MPQTDTDKLFEKNAIEAAIKIGILGTMVVWTVLIVQPFLMPVIWAVIIAVAMEPFIGWFAEKLGGRRKMASILFALLVIAILVIPSIMMATSSIDAIQTISAGLEEGTMDIPPPPASVKEWPLIGSSVYKTWNLAATNLAAALKQFGPQLKAAAAALLGSVGGGLKAVFMFVISVVIAAALLATAEKGSLVMTRIISRFVGEKGPEIIKLSTATIRGVMQGVVGVAIIQAVLSAIGMAVVGVPAAGLWAILVLILAVIQLPPIIVLAPIAGWVFTLTDTVPAVIFLVWALLVSASDGFLKPLLMGRGVDAPMLVILLGALGGMMLSGIIGLFVGAVVVAISYTLFMAWVEEHHLASPAIDKDEIE